MAGGAGAQRSAPRTSQEELVIGSRRVGLAWAFVGVLLFSFSVPLTKEAVGGFDPFLTATGRAVIAGALAVLLLAVRRVPLPPRRHWSPLFFTMLGAVFGWPILLALALRHTTSAHVAVIAAFMPLTTAVIAVLKTHERVSRQFWIAACAGTVALVAFAVSQNGVSGGSIEADLLVVGAVFSSAWCYVLGASVTRDLPGWQVISWVVVLALPLTVPASIVLWFATSGDYDPTAGAWTSLVILGVSSMYLGFFAWYHGLALAGIARGGQVQQVQPLLTLLWSALLLGEHITAPTVVAAVAVIAAVLWSQRGRASLEEAHERDAREDEAHPDEAAGTDVLRLESHPAELVDDE
jgi:drug/metabolite transporter (DMT)-like permease